MGIKLINEVMDNASEFELTPVEWKCLIVLAEDANDQTRETWRGTNDPTILRRIDMTVNSWKNVRARLLKKGVLEYATRDGKEVRGHRGSRAKFRIAALAKIAEASEKGHQTSDPIDPEREQRVTEPMTQSGPMGHQTDDPTSRKGHRTDAERVTEPVTPTPLVPSETSISDPPPAADGRVSLPADFKLDDQMRLWARSLGLADLIDIELHTDNFIDYYAEHIEKKNRNWRLTWQRWMRNEYDRAVKNGSKPRNSKRASYDPEASGIF